MQGARGHSSVERVLVTGGAGFIGSHLCDRLVAAGREVVALDNFDPFYDPALKRANLSGLGESPAFTLIEGDIRDPDDLARALDPTPDVVVHLAALAGVRPSIAAPDRYMDVNVVGSARLLQRCVDQGVRRVVFASSSSVYGDRQSVPFSETDPVDDPVSPYAASKKAGELLCHTFHHLHGLHVSCLRFFTVYGPRQRPEMAVHKFVDAVRRGRPLTLFGDGSSSRDYTYVDDIVAGVLAAMERLDGFRIYNLGGSTPVTLRELVAAIEGATGQSAQCQAAPDQAGDVTRTFADIDRARAELGYEPRTPLAEGLRRFVGWYDGAPVP